MANVLKKEKREQVVALGRLGWSLRRIEGATGVRRETAAAVFRLAGLPVRPSGRWGRTAGEPTGEPAAAQTATPPPVTEASADEVLARNGRGGGPTASHCEGHREFIEQSMDLGRNAMAIYQDLVDQHGLRASYKSVLRFVTRVRRERGTLAEPCGIIETLPGEEMQVDWGEGPLVRHPDTGVYKRTRLFVLTLGYSRKSVWLLSFQSSTRIWAELHEVAFRRLGGVTKVVVLDNLKEGVLRPDIWDPVLNPLYKAMLRHYGMEGLACRVGDPDRKGKVERAVGYAQGTPLKGLRFDSLPAAQAHLDKWAERWADTRVHGTTKRRVSEMFALEQPHLRPLPATPFCYFEFGTRDVHALDGCVQVDGAYYEAPPGLLGADDVPVQWDDQFVRVMSPVDGTLLVEHRRKRPGAHSLVFAQPSRTPPRIQKLLSRAAAAGKNIGALCQSIHVHDGIAGIRRIQGVLGLARNHGPTRVDDVCRLGLDVGVPTYKFVKTFIQRHPQQPHLVQHHPVIRQLTEYRDVIRRMTGDVP